MSRLHRHSHTHSHTVLRALHDLGLAAWFGGSLMGAVGLNGAADDLVDPRDRARAAVDGWARWAPVNAAAIGVHLIGATGLLVANRRRLAAQSGVAAASIAKTAVTAGALGATAYSGMLGRRLAEHGRVPAEGGTKPAESTPADAAAAQEQLRVLQWVNPALTAAIAVLGAFLGEQQQPSQILRGVSRRAWQATAAATGAAAAAVQHPGRTAKTLAGGAAAANPMTAAKTLTGAAAAANPLATAKTLAAVTAGKHPARTVKALTGVQAGKHPARTVKALTGVQAGKHPVGAAKALTGVKAAKLGGKHPARAARAVKALA